MFGKTRQRSYYACVLSRGAPEGHPSTVWAREDALLDGLGRFLTSHVFGPDRHALLVATLDEQDARARRERLEQLAALNAQVRDADVRCGRLVRSLELSDDVELVRDVQIRLAELRAERHQAADRLRALESHQDEHELLSLIDLLPLGTPDLSVPEAALRRFFEAARLEIRFDRRLHTARYALQLSAGNAGLLRQTATNILAPPTSWVTSGADPTRWPDSTPSLRKAEGGDLTIAALLTLP